jgi:hypothetical protein
VSPEVQQKRDVIRRDILTTELNAETVAWTNAGTALAAEPTDAHRADLHRHTQNIEALRREIEALPREKVSPLSLVARGRRAPVVAPEPAPKVAPFWDPYRRIASPSFPTTDGSLATVSSTSAKEKP